jgi:hypothetical protein
MSSATATATTAGEEEYVTYNGIPHRVLPKSQPQPQRDIVKDTLDLQRMILNPEDRPYILSEEQQRQQLVTRSASAATTTGKRLTIEKALELRQRILGQ